MIKDAMMYLVDYMRPEAVELDGRPYTTNKVYPVTTPLPDILLIHTLTGIADYLNENIDGLELDQTMIQVLSPTLVRVKSRLSGPFLDRLCYLDAKHEQPVFKFGGYMDIETFIIEMQAKFVPDEMTAKILQLVGTITDDQVQVYADDGVTQSVVAKTSVGMQAQREVPNPVTLSPYRTFNEICQPEGKFVLRMKSGTGTSSGRPAVMLVEADGGAWQNEAIIRIRDWLRVHVPQEVTILA